MLGAGAEQWLGCDADESRALSTLGLCNLSDREVLVFFEIAMEVGCLLESESIYPLQPSSLLEVVNSWKLWFDVFHRHSASTQTSSSTLTAKKKNNNNKTKDQFGLFQQGLGAVVVPEHLLRVAVQQWHCQAVKLRRLQLLSHWHRGAAEGLGVDTGVGGCPWVFLCSALSLILLAKCGGKKTAWWGGVAVCPGLGCCSCGPWPSSCWWHRGVGGTWGCVGGKR